MAQETETFHYISEKGYSITCTNVSEALKDDDVSEPIIKLIVTAAMKEKDTEKADKIWNLMPEDMRNMYRGITNKLTNLPSDLSPRDGISVMKNFFNDIPLAGGLDGLQDSLGGMLEGIFTGLTKTFPTFESNKEATTEDTNNEKEDKDSATEDKTESTTEDKKEEMKPVNTFDMSMFANMFQNMAKSLSEVQGRQSSQSSQSNQLTQSTQSQQ